uniref:ATP synthase complex subunit 8 n=1 Tax=Indostomus paradoxus TaxID=181450 RepID=Q8HLA1_INDPA|nr:ATP synthase F0 subunit 8 [Indostomus paradoxus]BAC23597.1 ATPase subunit 8 [Indostomus paradoxus]
MPQLTPNPWLYILLASWLVFLTVLPTKTLTYVFPNNPALKGLEKYKMTPWSWPWH